MQDSIYIRLFRNTKRQALYGSLVGLFCAFSVGICSIHCDGVIQEKPVVDESESAFISRKNSDGNYLMAVRAMPVNVIADTERIRAATKVLGLVTMLLS